jgi:hypothetical protein
MVILLIIGTLVLLESTKNIAQEAVARWSEPQVLFDTSEGWGEHNSLTADLFGGAHAVWEFNPSASSSADPAYRPDDNLFYYSHWDGAEWSAPIDILFGDISYPRIATDSRGKLHLVFDNKQCVAYIWAWIVQAGSARSWSNAVCAGPRALNHAIATDANGRLHVLLAQNGQMSYVQSDDGVIWSEPILITETPGNATYVPSLAADAKGRLHAVWTQAQLPDGIPFLGVYYSRSDDGGRSWSPSRQLISGNYRDPSIAVFGENVYVVWNSGVVESRRFLAYSQDGGITWATPIPIVQAFGGWLWHPGIAVDSAGTVHIITAQGVGALYTAFLPDGRVSTPLQLFDPNEQTSAPDLVTIKGNQLLAVFRGAGSLIYLTGTTSARSVSPLLLPTVVPAPTPTMAKQVPIPESKPTGVTEKLTSAPQVSAGVPSTSSHVQPLVWGIVPTVALVVGIVILVIQRRQRGYRR